MADAEISKQQKQTKILQQEQTRRELKLDKVGGGGTEPESAKHINEQTSRLAYLNDKLVELHE